MIVFDGSVTFASGQLVIRASCLQCCKTSSRDGLLGADQPRPEPCIPYKTSPRSHPSSAMSETGYTLEAGRPKGLLSAWGPPMILSTILLQNPFG